MKIKDSNILAIGIRKDDQNAETAANRISSSFKEQGLGIKQLHLSLSPPQKEDMLDYDPAEPNKKIKVPSRDEFLGDCAAIFANQITNLENCTLIIDTEADLLFNTIDALAKLLKNKTAKNISNIFIRVGLNTQLAEQLNIAVRTTQVISKDTITALTKQTAKNMEADTKAQVETIAANDQAQLYIQAKAKTVAEDKGLVTQFCQSIMKQIKLS